MVVAAGCAQSAPGDDTSAATTSPRAPTSSLAATTTTPSSVPAPTTAGDQVVDTGDLDSPDVRTVVVGGRELNVAWADDPAERSRGLMEVEDLGDLDGMLFDLGSERVPTFTMRNTLIALDIAFFDGDGVARGVVEMVPCESEPCPTYGIEEPARYALEVPAGAVPLSEDSMLEVP